MADEQLGEYLILTEQLLIALQVFYHKSRSGSRWEENNTHVLWLMWSPTSQLNMLKTCLFLIFKKKNLFNCIPHVVFFFLSCCSEVALRSPSPHSSRTPTLPPCCKPTLKLELCSFLSACGGHRNVEPEALLSRCIEILDINLWICLKAQFNVFGKLAYCHNPNSHMWMCKSQPVSELFVYLPSFEGGQYW